MRILTLNCWSYSIGYQLIDWPERAVMASGTVERVTLGHGHIVHRLPDRKPYFEETDCPDHLAAVKTVLELLTDPVHGVIASENEISAVGHRVVHGGEKFHHTVTIDDVVLAEIKSLVDLAPLHNANNIAGIEASIALLPNIPHAAIFDTAFHQTMPKSAYIYPLPYEWYLDYGVRRYGFHGPAHLYACRRSAVMLGKPWRECNLITLVSGKGVSLCAIRNGRSIDTSMGMTPLEGAVMETRCGDIDPGIPPFMMQELGLSAREMDNVLNQRSGLLGLAGSGHRARLATRALNGDEIAREARALESYRLRKMIGGYLAVIGKIDAVVITGAGAGKFDAGLREMTLGGLEGLGICLDGKLNRNAPADSEETLSTADSPVAILQIPSRVDLVMAEEVAALLEGTLSDPASFSYSFG